MIPGVQTYHPRTSWQDQRYPVFGPPQVAALNDTVVIHYTAADDLVDGDPGEHADNLPAYMRSMQRSYVLNRGYSLGYLFAVDWLGGVWEIRGWDFKSAANAGHNDHTFPILVLVDGQDGATPEATASIQRIGWEAQRRAGRTLAVKGHGQLYLETKIGTATACPGFGLGAQVRAGVFTPAPAPTIEGDDEEMAYLVVPPAERSGSPWLYVSSSVRPATSLDVADGVPQRKLTDQYRVEQYDYLRKAAGV